MAKLRNISDGDVELRADGFTALVAVDEVVEVPDAIFKAHEWADTQWAVVSTAKPKSTDKDGE